MSGKLHHPCFAQKCMDIVFYLIAERHYMHIYSVCLCFTLYSQDYTVEYVGYNHEWNPSYPSTSININEMLLGKIKEGPHISKIPCSVGLWYFQYNRRVPIFMRLTLGKSSARMVFTHSKTCWPALTACSSNSYKHE